jgi:hypothetical protein
MGQHGTGAGQDPIRIHEQGSSAPEQVRLLGRIGTGGRLEKVGHGIHASQLSGQQTAT